MVLGMLQVARNLLDIVDGFPKGKRVLLLDRDPLYTSQFSGLSSPPPALSLFACRPAVPTSTPTPSASSVPPRASVSTSSCSSVRTTCVPRSTSISPTTTKSGTTKVWTASSSRRPPTSTSRADHLPRAHRRAPALPPAGGLNAPAGLDRSSAADAAARSSASTPGGRPQTRRSSFRTLRERRNAPARTQ